jgi:hypothetical protein
MDEDNVTLENLETLKLISVELKRSMYKIEK